MKNITEIVKTISGYIFSFPTFMLGSFLLFFYFMTAIWEKENQERFEAKTVAATCYSMGMVDVDTAGGKRCVAPKDLHEPKIIEKVIVEK